MTLSRPHPVPKELICSECGLDWELHPKNASRADCIKLLREELEVLREEKARPVVTTSCCGHHHYYYSYCSCGCHNRYWYVNSPTWGSGSSYTIDTTSFNVSATNSLPN